MSKSFSIGDYVQMNDSPKIYVVTNLKDEEVFIIGVEMTERGDTTIPCGITVPIDELIEIDSSFVNVGGPLWLVRKTIMNNEEIFISEQKRKEGV